jgi:ankyrin repeat protein
MRYQVECVRDKPISVEQNATVRVRLWWAGAKGALNAIAALLEAGIEPDAKSMAGWTLLHHAAFNGRSELLEDVMARVRRTRDDISWSKALNAKIPSTGQTPMHLAAKVGPCRFKPML